MNINSKSFKIKLKNSQAYSFIIAGFQFATSLFFHIKFTIHLDLMPKFKGKIVSTINLRKVKLLISKTSLIGKLVSTVSLRTKLTYFMEQTMKFVSTISLRNPITFISKAQQKVTLIVTQKLKITANPTLAHFFSLGDYDPDTLGFMDTKTLGTLDFA